ncbi:MAG: hypothetical protein J5881_02165 [Clostridia bacterium]|nr:hypothetical protein [Clostridia bacterium]
MFLVLNREKISAYVISILTVCFLFFIANNATKNDINKTEPASVKAETRTEVNNEANNTNNNTTNVNNATSSGNTIQKHN